MIKNGFLLHLSLLSIAALMLFSVRCATERKNSNAPNSSITTAMKPTSGESFGIPHGARFEIKSYGIEPGQTQGYDAKFCNAHKPTEPEIREQFQIAHQLKERELHDYYIWLPCVSEGIIVYNGRTMKWRFRLGNIIETTFPDGVEKIIGGEHSDDPSGEK